MRPQPLAVMAQQRSLLLRAGDGDAEVVVVLMPPKRGRGDDILQPALDLLVR